MKLEKIELENLTELNADEASSITGGESFWYWVGYGVGATVSWFEGMKAYNTEHAGTWPAH
jgi:hypothetical protein